MTRCPACGRKTAHVRVASNGEDHLRCYKCKWWCFTQGSYPEDKVERSRWAAVNPTEQPYDDNSE